MADSDQITGAQVRMARAFLRWPVAELAKKAKVGISTVQRIEAVDGSPTISDGLEWRTEAREKALAAIRTTLVTAGITFLPDDSRGFGVRGRVKGARGQGRDR